MIVVMAVGMFFLRLVPMRMVAVILFVVRGTVIMAMVVSTA